MKSFSTFSQKLIVFVGLYLGLLLPIQAQEEDIRSLHVLKPNQNQKSSDITAGIVVNQSATFMGQNFYQAFVAAWSELDNEERFTITLKERPTAKDGAYITIEYRGRSAYSTQLSPISRNSIKTVAEVAANQVFQNILEIEVGKLFERDADLGNDEL